ncbi:hypothetical protein DPMN_150759 [Dreissena polymorpha]|uniref:Uncharacterized protein n=1 Tax=Dreissena polymorpha TaxID=45954 RepID=A0A9D4FE06_DREPO|nr:hypothetical protein DPMN_150759 [Dreissena polymorpha]
MFLNHTVYNRQSDILSQYQSVRRSNYADGQVELECVYVIYALAAPQGMPDLNLPDGAQVLWMGVCGMGSADAVHKMQLPALFRMPPKVQEVHLGGTDLVRHNL